MTEKESFIYEIEESPKEKAIREIAANLSKHGFEVVELNDSKPWGAYVRIDSSDADKFIEHFFKGLDPTEARLGNPNAELSPKILLVSPGHRLSWQYHDRRSERWRFLTEGAYNKSLTDDPGGEISVNAGAEVQFESGERHRLIGSNNEYTIVAEIWQHSDNENLSDESDIVRLQDDYSR